MTAPAPPRPPPWLEEGRLRAFVDEELIPGAAELDRDERVPRWIADRLAQLGLWGANLSEEVGGAGAGMLEFGRAHQEVGRGCSSVRSMLTVHSMVAWAIDRWGSAEQCGTWLPRLASGAVTGAFCLTEPDAGSDAAAVATSASRRSGGWVLSGHKKWITGGQTAGLFLVFASTEAGMAAFLVPRDTPGIEVTPITRVLGTRASMLAEIRLRQCRVTDEALLGSDGFALPTVMTGALDIGRYSVACGCVGIIQGCLDACADFTTQRIHRSHPLKERDLIRRMMSNMVVSAEAARLLCDRAGRLKDAGDPATMMATWIAKYFAAGAAVEAARDAVQIHGASGCLDEHPVARYYRDAKIMEIIEGSSEVQQLVIADAAYQGRTS